MAKIETTFIRPKEEFNVDTGKAKVTYDGYQNNPHEIELKENLEGDVEGVINDTFKENDNNNVAFTDNEGNEHELITSEGFGDALNEALPAALANAQVIKTTWSELKALRDGGNLIAGSLYRITDYQCTTTQENTQSAGHQFDIVLLALSNNKLAEEGWAMEHPTDVYDVICTDNIIIKCYYYPYYDEEERYDRVNLVNVDTLLGYSGYLEDYEGAINHETKTITVPVDSATILSSLIAENLTYNYFQNSNLSAWKVWYCLDNDTSRFAWADDSVDNRGKLIIEGNETFTVVRDSTKDKQIEGTNYYAWLDEYDNTNVYTENEFPNPNDKVYGIAPKIGGGYNIIELASVVSYSQPTNLPNGRGVIYRLVDEFNNDVAYDFKNIQYVRKLTDGYYDEQGEDTWVYTFTNIDNNNIIEDGTLLGGNAYNKIILTQYSSGFKLPDIVSIDKGYGHSYNNFNKGINITIHEDVSNAKFINCANFALDDTNGAIYINNKKVLTEE